MTDGEFDTRGFEHLDQPVCSECKRPCHVRIIETGRGSYEYWGQKGYDFQVAEVSDCCEAEIWPAEKLLALLAEDES